jgi:transcriptional regulator with XRE-family HTH domain
VRRFGDKLRALRIYHHLTLSELSSRLGYNTHSYISEIESGRKTPTVGFVLKVADLFHVTTDQLLRDELEIALSSTIHDENPDES